MIRRFHCSLKNLGDLTRKQGRRVVAIVVGSTVVLIGVILLFVPGPGTVIIYAGIAILATELVWARSLLRTINKRAKEIGDAINDQARSVWPSPESTGQLQPPSRTRPASDGGQATDDANDPSWRDCRPGTSRCVSRPNSLDQNLRDRMIDEGCPNY